MFKISFHHLNTICFLLFFTQAGRQSNTTILSIWVSATSDPPSLLVSRRLASGQTSVSSASDEFTGLPERDKVTLALIKAFG